MFETVLSDEDMVAQFGDTSSTLMPLELAPPTKEMMYWLDAFTDGLFFSTDQATGFIPKNFARQDYFIIFLWFEHSYLSLYYSIYHFPLIREI